jgi:transcriptional regulator with XRE-family HTH domain
MERLKLKKPSVNRQLGDFLRQRRERLTPREVGIPTRLRRRTPGLRREEVAELAGISIDWYTRLEQGRESLPSKATAEALAQALLLSATDRSHLLKLATGDPGRIFKRESMPAHLVELVQELSVPAYIIGTRFDLLCWNKAASEIFRDFSKVPEDQRNTLYQMFTSAEVRERYPNWESEARAMLESFRVTYDFWAHAPEFIALKDELCLRSPEFRKWWKTHQIRAKHSGEKVLKHRKLGEIRLRYSTFQSNDNPDLRLVLYSREGKSRL